MANKPANAKQKKWMASIAEFAESNLWSMYGEEYECSDYQLHHVLGRSAKHNKVAIGHWFIIPVPFELHDVSSSHPDNVTHHKNRFTARFDSQRTIFNRMINIMQTQNYEIPDYDICRAIESTNA